MRGFVLVFFASISLFGGTVDTSATCDGVTYQGSDSASCGNQYADASAQAQASLTSMSVYASAQTWMPTWGVSAGSSSATASLSQDFILTVTGGYGDGYAQPEFSLGSHSYFGVGWGTASISLGGCSEFSSGGGQGVPCPTTSVAFVFGVPQTLTLSESAWAGAGGYFYGVGTVGGLAGLDGFSFSGWGSSVTYTFVPAPPPSPTPEPGTLALTAMACAALIAFAGRRRSRDRKVARPAR